MSIPIEPSRLLDSVVSLARDAGREIMSIYPAAELLSEKVDHSPLTQADLASHHCLVNGLAQLADGVPILSEEAKALPFETRATWDTYWLIDPLDGTKEFLKRNGEFTVNVALIHRHVPVLGVVDVPARGVTYFAAEGVGAFRQVDDHPPTRLGVVQPSAQPCRVVGSRSHGSDDMSRYLQRLGEHEMVPVGSSLKFCYVAEGRADLYPRLGPTSEWDTAAAQCVVEQAGGVVLDLQGQPLRYNTKASLLNPYFIVAATHSPRWLACADGIDGWRHLEAPSITR